MAPDGSVVATGRVVDKEAGIYAARIVALSKLQKDLVVAGPPQIECNRDSGDFKVTMPGPIEGAFYNGEDPRIFELYISRLQIAKIAYGEPSNDRVKVSQLEVAYSVPMEQIPDPRTVLEDAADFEKEERDRAMKHRKEAELEAIRIAEKEARDAELAKKKQAMLEARVDESDEEIEEDASQGMDKRSRSRTHNNESETNLDDDDPDAGMGSDDGEGEDVSDDSDDDMAELPSQAEMKRDLITAIQEEMRERETLRRENDDLQKQILAMDQSFDTAERASDVQMNEHKYLNTLANVHQVRINLKETQDRYNKMASELQAKLNEK